MPPKYRRPMRRMLRNASGRATSVGILCTDYAGLVSGAGDSRFHSGPEALVEALGGADG